MFLDGQKTFMFAHGWMEMKISILEMGLFQLNEFSSDVALRYFGFQGYEPLCGLMKVKAN